MISYKKVFGKKSSYGGKCLGTKDVYNPGKKGLVIKTYRGMFNMQMYRRKVLFIKTSQT